MTTRAVAHVLDMQRAIKAAQACGLVVRGMEQTRDGFRLIFGDTPLPLTPAPQPRDPAEMARQRREAASKGRNTCESQPT